MENEQTNQPQEQPDPNREKREIFKRIATALQDGDVRRAPGLITQIHKHKALAQATPDREIAERIEEAITGWMIEQQEMATAVRKVIAEMIEPQPCDDVYGHEWVAIESDTVVHQYELVEELGVGRYDINPMLGYESGRRANNDTILRCTMCNQITFPKEVI